MSSIPDIVARSTSLSTSHFMEHIHIFTQFGVLSPTQILSIFNEFVHWPEYGNCSFAAALEKELIKQHTKPDDDASDDEAER
jgi:dimethyladenosine transferase 2